MEIALIIVSACLIAQSAFLIYVGFAILRHQEPDKPPLKLNLMPHKPAKETDEQRRERLLWENIENYDGTPKGQQKL
jgi:hypothetical protein